MHGCRLIARLGQVEVFAYFSLVEIQSGKVRIPAHRTQRDPGNSDLLLSSVHSFVGKNLKFFPRNSGHLDMHPRS